MRYLQCFESGKVNRNVKMTIVDLTHESGDGVFLVYLDDELHSTGSTIKMDFHTYMDGLKDGIKYSGNSVEIEKIVLSEEECANFFKEFKSYLKSKMPKTVSELLMKVKYDHI